jgi:tetratricopeptide (TPR) repeat protein
VLVGPPLVVAAPPLAAHLRRFARGFREPAGAFGAATLAFLLLFGLLYAGYNRFIVMLIFFVAAAGGGYAALAARRRGWWWLLVPALALPLEGIKAFRYEDRPWPWTALLKAAAAEEAGGYATNVGDEEWRVIRWFGNQGDRAEPAVLAPIAASASFLTYAGTPVVLHPIYEAPGLRAKVDECWQALYRGEEDFWGVCRKYDVTYVAYHASMLVASDPETIRYAHAVTAVRSDSCAYRMQFEPATLRHFAPIFETISWRIFLVGVPGEEAPDLGPSSPLFTGPARTDGYYDETFGARAYAALDEAVESYNDGVERYERGDFDAARGKYERALDLCPRLAGAWDALAWLELEAGNGGAAARAAEHALTLDPYDDAARAALARLRSEGR